MGIMSKVLVKFKNIKIKNYYAADFGVCLQFIIKTSLHSPDASEFTDSLANANMNESNQLNLYVALGGCGVLNNATG